MNLKIPAGLLHATRLVRGGKLTEATDAIQRALRGGDASPTVSELNGDALAFDDFCRVVNVESPVPVRGQFVNRSYTNAAGTREYKIYIPANYCGPFIATLRASRSWSSGSCTARLTHGPAGVR